MDTVKIYKTLKKDDLLVLILDRWGLWVQALLDELKNGEDIIIAEMYESQASLLLYDKKQLIDKLIKMDKYIDKYNENNDKKSSTHS
jgi:hypothetical protein